MNDDEPAMCGMCNGTGIGRCGPPDLAICGPCKGTGDELPPDDYEPDPELLDDDTHDWIY